MNVELEVEGRRRSGLNLIIGSLGGVADSAHFSVFEGRPYSRFQHGAVLVGVARRADDGGALGFSIDTDSDGFAASHCFANKAPMHQAAAQMSLMTNTTIEQILIKQHGFVSEDDDGLTHVTATNHEDGLNANQPVIAVVGSKKPRHDKNGFAWSRIMAGACIGGCAGVLLLIASTAIGGDPRALRMILDHQYLWKAPAVLGAALGAATIFLRR